MKRQKRICEQCGKEYITDYPAKQSFCSRACRVQFRVVANSVPCAQCGRVFVKDSRSENKFCSHACYGESLKGQISPSYNPIGLACAQCNKPFAVQQHRLGKAKFCSTDCRVLAKAVAREKKCKQCGSMFQIKWRNKNVDFCSRKCMGEGKSGQQSPSWKSVEIPCAYCSQVILRPPNRVKKSTNLFCGQECYSQWMSDFKHGEAHPCWKGGWHHYGENWTRQRHKVRERDGYKCQVCGVSEKKLGQQLDIHHITPFKTFNGDYVSANQLSNLICVCRTCHQKAEHGKVAFQPSLL